VIAALAGPQGGHVTRVQLLGLGCSAGAITRWVERGLLHPVYRGVYAVGHVPTHPVAVAKGALLATGERSTLFLESAGAYWEMCRSWPAQPVIAVATDRRPRGITVHHISTLTRPDVWEREPHLRVTTPARTLLDLAPLTAEDRLAWLVANSQVRHLTTVGQIASVIDRNPRHPGAQPLARLLGLGEPPRSPWEQEFPRFATVQRIEGYEMNAVLGDIRVDILYRDRLVVWLDGWETHKLKPAFERDRAEANELLAERGIPNIRVTHQQFHETPDRVGGWIRRSLAHRPAGRPGGAAPQSAS
jgi:hypothetical protein